jgi:aminoglycoside 3'-phosphotransferase-2
MGVLRKAKRRREVSHLTAFDILGVLPAEWRSRLAECELVPVTSGMSGACVFRVRAHGFEEHYLKIATGTDVDHLRGEAERTKWLASMGIRVPNVIAQFDGDDAFAMTMTALRGASAEHADRENWQPVVTAIARGFAALHALPVDACPFDETLKVRLARAHDLIRQGAIDGFDFDVRNLSVAPVDLYERLAATIPPHDDAVVVHGDATLTNLIVGNDGAIGFIDCGNCGKADRYVDLAVLVEEIADRFGDQARNAFLRAYDGLVWDERKAAFYRDLYELF